MKKNNYKNFIELLEFSPNLVLYGNSGTGKTYTARKIVEEFEKKYHQELDFASIEKQNRAKFISFHKLYSYNDFIERRINIENEEVIKNGALLEIAINASLEIMKSSIKGKIKNSINSQSKVWKVSLGYRKTEERIYKQCKKNKEIVIGWLEYESLEGKSYNEIYSMLEIKRGKDEPKLSNDVSSISALVNDMKKGDLVLIYSTPTTIIDIGIVEGDYFHNSGEPYPHKRKVSWFKEFKKPIDISSYDNKTRLSLKTIYELDQINFSDLREIIQDNDKKISFSKDNIKPYYLLIDDIDQGDILSIFGESISLIDQRDIYRTILTYSKKTFSLPSNLYIIATSNQVFKDRFLQRRFIFNKLIPEPSYLENIFIDKNISLIKLMNKINTNITEILGEQAQLGHGYFINLKTISDLYNFWYYRFIPLLESLSNIEDIKKIIGQTFFEKHHIVYLTKEKFEEAIINFIEL